MYRKFILLILIILTTTNCAKEESVYQLKDKVDPYKLYEEGFNAFNNGDYFFAEKKFSEAELNFKIIEFAAKSAIMSSYALYGINFYTEALENLDAIMSTPDLSGIYIGPADLSLAIGEEPTFDKPESSSVFSNTFHVSYAWI